MADLLE
jgi:hypothetical protein